MSGSPYEADVEDPQATGQQVEVPPPPGSMPDAPPAIDQNPTQLGFPQRPPPPPQFIGYGVDGQPLYGYKPGMSPLAKLALAVMAAGATAYAIGAAGGRRRRSMDDDD